jgi:hypothetical protein
LCHKKTKILTALLSNEAENMLRKTPIIDFRALKASRAKELKNVSEVIQRAKFVDELSSAGKLRSYLGKSAPVTNASGQRVHDGQIPQDKLKSVIDSGILTFLLHW